VLVPLSGAAAAALADLPLIGTIGNGPVFTHDGQRPLGGFSKAKAGRPMKNLGEYHIPVNADVPSLEAILVEERDPHVNALGIKGVGEIGITGSAGAVANAVWHATGVRVRKFPITLDRFIDTRSRTTGLPR
jgi:hypothetical protein